MNLTTEHFSGKKTERVGCRGKEKTALSSPKSPKVLKPSVTHRHTTALQGTRGLRAKLHFHYSKWNVKVLFCTTGKF